ncbi:MAG: YidC/Oxa1 family membrane protein insertase [Patescibacteria group bacterium]|nr:YidC/Oxa1 family membrane protein insertase [Patescibacteria group bacterium]MDD5490783.1 YidC/Oxa1 family membrane protein insertase [Patescibacteria group bacterium]
MMALYNTILYQPLFNLLVFFYNIIPGHDVGLAIIALTIVIKLILFPFSLQSIKSQKSLQSLQPKIEELKKKYKDQKDKMAQAMMELYKQEKVNPFSSCLPLLIQLPFLLAVYQVFRSGLASNNFNLLYSFVANPEHINTISFGFINLAQSNIYLAVLAGLAQFWQTKMMMAKRPPAAVRKEAGAKDEDMSAIMNKQMTYFMPIFTVFIGASLPAGLTLYWFITTLLTALQQLYFLKNDDKNTAETV